MGKRYKLVQETYRDGRPISYQTIVTGRKAVGRVYFNKILKSWVGVVRIRNGPNVEANGATASEAFDAVISKHLGFNNVTELRQHNQEVRRRNAELRHEARQAFNEAFSDDPERHSFERLADLISKL